MTHECGSCTDAGCTGQRKAPGEDSRLRRALNERDRLAHALRLIADGRPRPIVPEHARAVQIARAALAEVER